MNSLPRLGRLGEASCSGSRKLTFGPTTEAIDLDGQALNSLPRLGKLGEVSSSGSRKLTSGP